MDNELLTTQYIKLIETLRNNITNIDSTINQLNTIDNAIDYINILKNEIKKCQVIHKKMFGENCCDDIILPNINHSVDEYQNIVMKEMKKYLENIYNIIDISEIIIEYIEKLKQILEKCKENIFLEIEKLKSNCDELILTIEKTISTISSSTIKTEKENKLKVITDKHNYGDDLFTNYEKSLENYKKLKKIYDELELFNIEEFGKVKVYVKLRPSKAEGKLDGEYKKYNNIIDIDDVDKKIKIKCKEKENDYGPFKDICSGSNEDLFNMIQDDFTWEQIKDKTTILFSYGISGSGKSYTMFNTGVDEGLIFRIVDSKFGYSNIKSKDIGSKFEVSVEEIFEHKFIDDNFIKFSGTNVEFEPTNLKGQKSLIIVNKSQNIDKIIENVTTSRTENGTIKHTPNNPVSSRSHLFIVLKITKNGKDGDKGYIVICDSAGRESPLEIAKSYYSEKASPSQIFQGGLSMGSSVYTNITISKLPEGLIKSCATVNCNNYKKDKDKEKYKELQIGNFKKDQFDNIKEINKYIQDIAKEGFFINESLNHMVKYLDESIVREDICLKNTVYPDSKCSVEKYNLHKEEKNKIYTFQNPNPEDDQIGTYTIFNELINLSGGKYRFIMIANSRTEEDKCNSIQSTFDFVDKIKST